MIVRVGTANAVKVRAARQAFRLFFPKARFEAVEVESGVSSKPASLGEIIRGAKNRARRCRGGADFGVGIEAGHFRLAGRASLVTIACVTDGRRSALGGSPFFEYDLALAPRDETGIIGALTGRKITREEVTRWAVVMALAGIPGRPTASASAPGARTTGLSRGRSSATRG